MDKYNISLLADYEYDLKVKLDGCKTYEDKISTNINASLNGGVRSTDSYYIVIPKVDDTEKNKIMNTISEYYEALYDGINNKKNISDLKSYFVDETSYNNFANEFVDEYDDLIKGLRKESSYKTEIDNDYKLESIEPFLDGIYYLSNDSIVFVGALNYKYHHEFYYTNYMSSFNDSSMKNEDVKKSKNFAIVLSKKNGKYKVSWGSLLSF